jgi:Putative adhesin
VAQGARVTNVSGDVRVLVLDQGSLHVRSVSGNVLVGVATGVDLHVDVESVSGEITSDIALGDAPGPERSEARVDVSVRSVSGDVAIERALEQVA